MGIALGALSVPLPSLGIFEGTQGAIDATALRKECFPKGRSKEKIYPTAIILAKKKDQVVAIPPKR
jgi:hypothetical protein